MLDENDLIRAAAAGDRSAFERLVRMKRQQVVRTAFQVTGDMEDALDVAQGVFLKLWQGLNRFDPARRFDTWLYRITMNAAIDHIRSRGPKGTLQPLPDELPPEAGRDPVREADAALDLPTLRRAFLHLAGRLAPKQRAAFVLREIEGLSTAEVAAAMEVAESTVRNHLLQARRAIRAGLEREYPDLARRTGRQGDADRGRE